MLSFLIALFFGWNLISGNGMTPGEFHHEHRCTSAIYTYENGQWQSWFPPEDFHGAVWAMPLVNRVEVLYPWQAYWVYCDE